MGYRKIGRSVIISKGWCKKTVNEGVFECVSCVHVCMREHVCVLYVSECVCVLYVSLSECVCVVCVYECVCVCVVCVCERVCVCVIGVTPTFLGSAAFSHLYSVHNN